MNLLNIASIPRPRRSNKGLQTYCSSSTFDHGVVDDLVHEHAPLLQGRSQAVRSGKSLLGEGGVSERVEQPGVRVTGDL